MLINKLIKENKLFPIFFIFLFITFSLILKNITNMYSYKYILEIDDKVIDYFYLEEKISIISSIEKFLEKNQKENIIISKETELSYLINFKSNKKIDNESIKNYNLNILNNLNSNQVKLFEDFINEAKIKKDFIVDNSGFRTILLYKKNQYSKLYKKYDYYKKLIKKSFTSVNSNVKSEDTKSNFLDITTEFDDMLNKIDLFINQEKFIKIINEDQIELKNYKKLEEIIKLQKEILIDLDLTSQLIETNNNLALLNNFKKINQDSFIKIDNSNYQDILKIILRNDIYISLFLTLINHQEFNKKLSEEKLPNNIKDLRLIGTENKLKNIYIDKQIWKINFLKFERYGLSKIIKYTLILIYSILLSLILTKFMNDYKNYLKV